jgi:predicted dehydrogenase
MNILQFGFGKWGQNHRRILTELGHQVHSIDIEEGAQFAPILENIGVNKFYDAVIITTSSVNHFPISMRCIELGIPVFCEKPVLLKESQLECLERAATVYPRAIYMSGHQLVFMEDISRWLLSSPGNVIYMNSMRNGGIPRDEGALFSLMVHDIALAHFATGCDSFDCIDVDGNKHEIRAILVNGNVQVDLYAISVSKVRFRHTTFFKANGEKLCVVPDNWNRMDLLKIELERFLYCVERGITSGTNGLIETVRIMKTVFKIQNQLDQKKI